MLNFIATLTGGSFFLLAFIVAINSKRVNRVANRWLAVFLLCVAFVIIDEPLANAHFYTKFPIFIGLINLPVFALAPVLYLTVAYFVTPAKQFRRKDLGHFLLFFVMTLLSILILFVPSEQKIKDLETPNANDDTLGLTLIVLPLAIYWAFSYKKLLTHQKNVRLFSSSTETIDLAWLRYFLWGLAFMLLALLSDYIVVLPLRTYITSLIYLVSAFYLAYFALQQVEIFSTKSQETLDIKTVIEENERTDLPKKQLLNDEQLTTLKQTLTQLMQTEKPYLDSTLSLSKLAQMMHISTHELSYLINIGFDDNFSGFVNRYRVEESKRLLTTPQYQHLSMVGIAFEAGFNSKTAFNTAFKKLTAISPTEFQKLKDS